MRYVLLLPFQTDPSSHQGAQHRNHRRWDRGDDRRHVRCAEGDRGQRHVRAALLRQHHSCEHHQLLTCVIIADGAEIASNLSQSLCEERTFLEVWSFLGEVSARDRPGTANRRVEACAAPAFCA